ncbi:acetyl-CoA carboxylase biotin carboxyl carrier protein subunit [Bacillus piscicola]|uniref:acetyl-CoA carboxylase biotin carboxyl carrier protein subunit n=1 Tax=Bacillus piscicola TaxID=1632684 RepID=UPI001F096B5E|nr:acetyl-CoA carboxylase biotin carboxyl carrier protein subunit [Bacillus piscicola]
MSHIPAPIAGVIWKMLVNEGDEVHADDEVAILESMKMEIPITAEQNGFVAEVVKKQGEFVNSGDILIKLR